MTRLIFIHGTGVREEGFENCFSLLTRSLLNPDRYKLVPCFWGEQLGAFLGADGYSVPGPEYLGHSNSTASNSGSPSSEETSVQAWTLLDLDPWSLVKVELLTSDGVIRDARQPHRLTASFEEAFTAAIMTENKFTKALNATPLGGVAKRTLDALVQNPLFEEYTSSLSIDAGSKISGLSGTYVALALSEWDFMSVSPIGIAGDHRQLLEALLTEELGGEVRSLTSGVVKVTTRLLWPLMAPSVERRRHELTRIHTPVAGDVLKYLSRPQKFREHLVEVIDRSTEPTIILAHSLGAIIAFDTLCTTPRPQIVRLISVGTQIGLLYELDALSTLEHGESLPSGFPKWDNIYDRRDFLAYRTSALFDEFSTDHQINNKSPFPRCHSAYFDNLEFYTLLDRILS